MDENDWQGVQGLHFHIPVRAKRRRFTSYPASGRRAVRRLFWPFKVAEFRRGAPHYRADYDRQLLISEICRIQNTYGLQVYLEPGEAVVLNTGFLVCRVVDLVQNGMEIAILDTSAACHMPDVLEMPYRPPLQGSGLPNQKAYTYRLAGPPALPGM